MTEKVSTFFNSPKMSKVMPFVKILPFVLLFVFAIYRRMPYFTESSKDLYAYERAIVDLFNGKNPYIWTIESYSNPDDPSNHGYAYLPGLLYLYGALYLIATKFSLSYVVLWKIPVLLADIGVGLLLIKKFLKDKTSFADTSKKPHFLFLNFPVNYFACLFAVALWFFNPYAFFRTGYTYSEPITIFLMFLALEFLEKDDVVAGALFALSIIFKTFPIILFPLFLYKSKNKWNFIIAGALVGILFSLPFMTSLYDLVSYLRGSVFIHSERFVQGRPFLFYISYYYKVELFQIINLKYYTYAAMLGGWLLITLLYFFSKIKDTYILSTISFLNFYLFTPVLNRTYLIWFLPVFILGAFNISKKRKYIYYAVLISYYVFYSWYLLQWEDGFHVWHP